MGSIRVLGVALAASTLAGCAGMGGGGAGGRDVPADVVTIAQTNRNGGEFVLEMMANGEILACEAAISPSDVPAVCREAADRAAPGGEVVGAEREWAGGVWYWEIIKQIGGRRIELLMNDAGTVVGREDSLQSGEYPAIVLDAALKAVGNGELVVVERVTGPEAMTGENYHVKIRTGDEVQRVSVREDGSIVRVMRKMKAEVRVPR
jgi:hypothetical protein